jgi:hypothetical protein
VWFAGFVALCVVAGVALAIGAPVAVVVIVVSGIGVPLLFRALGERREAKVEAAEPGALDAYPLRFPATRWPVGSPWQFRFAPRSSKGWAPGILGIGHDQVRFVPSSSRRGHLAWTGRPTSAEVVKTWQVCAVRFHGPDGSAQFSVQVPAATMRAYLAPMVPLAPEAVRTPDGR